MTGKSWLPQLQRHSCCLVLLLACLTALAPGRGLAQESSRALLDITRITVPADDPAAWPSGDWEPLPVERFEALVAHATRADSRMSPAWIESADYTAELVGNTLRAGTLTASVRCADGPARLMTLDPLNLIIDALWWDADQPHADPAAVWGTAADNRTALLVDRPPGPLHGSWTMKGRPLAQGFEFDLRLMPATVSRLTLRVPTGFNVTATHGDLVSLPTDDPLVREHRITLGSRPDCRLRVIRAPSGPPPKPQLLVESDVSHIVRRDGLQIQARFLVEVLREPVNRLVFSVPQGVDVYSVTWGNDTQLAWNARRVRGVQNITVDFPEPLLGKTRAIRILGLAPTRLGESWPLPRIVLSRAVDLGGPYQLTVERPLQLRDLELRGYRQTGTVSRPGEATTFSFVRYLSNTRFDAVIDAPRRELSGHVVSHMDLTAEAWSCASEVTWQVQSGSAFAVRALVAPGWEITDVRAPEPRTASSPLQWEVQADSSRGMVLRVECSVPLTSGQSRTVQVSARRPVTAFDEELPLPVVQPLDVGSFASALAVTHRPGDTVRLNDPLPFTKLNAGTVPDFARSSPLWNRLGPGDPQFLQRFSTNGPAAATLNVVSLEPLVKVRAHIAIDLQSPHIEEQVQLNVEPQGQPIDRVLVYVTRGANVLKWSASGDLAVSVVPQPLSDDLRAEWDLPTGGELRELRLSRPMREAFSLTGVLSAPAVDGEPLTLVSVPGARDFAATVELRTDDQHDWNADAIGLDLTPQENRITPSETEPPPTMRRWTYDEITGSSSLRLRKLSVPETGGGGVLLKICSMFAPVSGGMDVHDVHLTILPRDRVQAYRFSLPETATVAEIRLNDEPVGVSHDGSGYVVPGLSPGQTNRIDIRYRTDSPSELLRASRSVVLPQMSEPILDFRWVMALPPGARLSTAPEDVRLREPLPTLSWTTRLFGPLGRPTDAPIFNPLLRDSWTGASPQVSTTVRSVNEWSESDPLPPGWTVLHASALQRPESLSLVLWDEARVWLTAWIVLFAFLILGLLLRLGRVPRRQRLAALTLGGLAAVATVASPMPALIAGGGIAGSLLTVFLPRRFLFRPLRRQDEQSTLRDPASDRLRRAGVTVALLASLAASRMTGRAADPPVGGNAAHPAIPALSVMIPTTDKGRPADGMVYVTKALRSRLEAAWASSEKSSAYLVSSATYRGAVDLQKSVTLAAHYRLSVLATGDPVRVWLPLSGAYLVQPGVCLVDGQPHSILFDKEKNAWLLELQPVPGAVDFERGRAILSWLGAAGHWSGVPPMVVLVPAGPVVRSAEVVLPLVVPTTLTPEGGQFQLEIPPVATSRMELTFAEPPRQLAVPEAYGDMVLPDQTGMSRSLLGRTGTLHVLWSAQAEAAMEQPVVEAKIACLAELHPLATQLRYRVGYRVTRGQVSSVSWQLPSGMIPRIPPDAPFTWSLGPEAGGREQLLIEFAAPQSGEFVVDVPVTLPVAARDSMVRLPALTLSEPMATVSSYQTGLAASAPFKLIPQNSEMDGVQRITAAALAESFPRMAGLEMKSPELAYQSPKPTDLAFELVLAAPQRKVWLTQSAQADAGLLTWTANANLEITGAPAYRHVVHVDPALTIDSVAVREGEINRLLHWTRQGDRVVIFLSDQTTGTQFLSLTGTRTLPLEAVTPLPLVRVDEAELVDSRLTVVQGNDLTVEFAAETPPAVMATGDDDGVVREYRLSSDTTTLTVVARRREERPSVESITSITADGEALQLWNAMRISGLRPQSEPTRLRIPPELVVGHQLTISGADETLDPQADGSLDLLIQPTSDEAPVVTVVAPLQPPTTSEWTLPEVRVDDLEVSTRSLMLPEGWNWEPRDLPPTGPGRETRPQWINEHAPGIVTAGPTYVVHGTTLAWELSQTALTGNGQGLRIELLDTQLSWSRDAEVRGTTTLILVTSRNEPLTLAWPASVQLMAAVLDETLIAASPDAATGHLVLPVAPARAPRRLELHWTSAAAVPGWLDPSSLTLPAPVNIRSERGVIESVAPARTWVVRESGWEAASPLEPSVARLEGSVFALAATESADESPLLRPTIQLYDLVVRELTDRQHVQGLTTAEQSLWERLDRLSEPVETLRPDRPPLPQSASAATFPEPVLPATPDGDWRSAAAHVSSGSIVLAPGTVVSQWTIPSRLLQILLGTAIGLSVVLIVWKLLRPQWSDWLHGKPALACLLLGLLWWMFLAPSVVGVGLILLSGSPALRTAHRPATAPSSAG